MPNVPGVWRALGDVAQSQGRYKEALGALSARRHSSIPTIWARSFASAARCAATANSTKPIKAFDVVAAIDKDYPGLALERGLLFEASGHSEEALQAVRRRARQGARPIPI